MNAMNYKSVRKEARRENHRRIAVPKGSATKHLKNPFHKQFVKGEFRNDIYTNYSPLFIAWVYIRTLILFLIPAVLLHAPILLIEFVNVLALGEGLDISGLGTYLALIYGIPLFFAFRRISDHMAYYRVTELVGKHNLNQLVQMSQSNVNSGNKELAVMNHTRKRINKVNLFPSAKEFAVEEQLFQKEQDSPYPAIRNFAHSRKDAMSMLNKTTEHYAAKAIADQQQRKDGGLNEYDEQVRRYKHRTTPAIRQIIAEVQGSY